MRKPRLILKFMMSQTGRQIITMHILANISRSKSSQKMKFGQLIENNMRNIFLENSYTKCGGEKLESFYKKSKLSISQDQQPEISGFLIVEGAWGDAPHLAMFFETAPPKLMPLMGCPPPFKNEAPQLKNNPPLLKHETLFHEIIPRKSTINNNLISN